MRLMTMTLRVRFAKTTFLSFWLSSTACIVRKRPVLHLPSKTLTMAKSSEGFLLVLTLFKNLGLSLTRLSQHAYEPQGRKIRNNSHLLEP